MTTRILLVDDDAAVPKLISIYLRRFLDDFVVDASTSGEESIESIKSKVQNTQSNSLPDITVLDYRMPGVGGLEASAELTELGIKNIYIMTAYLSPDIIVAAQLAGAKGIMKKSEGFQEIAKKIAEIARTL
jgi:CheY-like chemotaxis protein